ncbi:MAG: hypothetical protein K6F94_09170 [Bacteroidaceae bacterium]|nr:hypothetical protein [Bacteroidaceae bacterium]
MNIKVVNINDLPPFSVRPMTLEELATYYFPNEKSLSKRITMLRIEIIEKVPGRTLEVYFKPQNVLINVKVKIKETYIWMIIRHLGTPPKFSIKIT